MQLRTGTKQTKLVSEIERLESAIHYHREIIARHEEKLFKLIGFYEAADEKQNEYIKKVTGH